MNHMDFLRNVSLFESLDQQELEALSDLTFTRSFGKDGVIILAEEEGDYVGAAAEAAGEP